MQRLDCKDLHCPIPITKLAIAVGQLESGDQIEIEATDPAFEADLRAWAEMTGHEIVEFATGDVQRANIRVT